MAHVLDGLPSFTREEAGIWNWYCRAVPGVPDWKAWGEETFRGLIEKPAGNEIRITQGHLLDQQKEDKLYPFGNKAEIFIGRGIDNDIVLPVHSIATKHARVVIKDGQFFVEDLGSSLGTYLKEKKLQPKQLEPVGDGGHFTIFPYSFTLRLSPVWVPEPPPDFSACHSKPATWGEFSKSRPAGFRQFSIQMHPGAASASLELDGAFLDALVSRILGPLGVEPGRARVASSDEAIFDFLILSMLDRANRRIRFPFQVVLSKAEQHAVPQEKGIAIEFSVGLSELTGAFRAFLPYPFLGAISPADPAAARVFDPTDYPARLTWRFAVSHGSVDLTAEEMRRLEVSDILLFRPRAALLFPGDYSKGWQGTVQGDNPWRVAIDKYFERSALMESGVAEGSAAQESHLDLNQLPLRLQVVLGEKEFTLAQVQTLAAGAIVELASGKSDPVHLAINGKFVGEGELVDVDGKLGVKILNWRGA